MHEIIPGNHEGVPGIKVSKGLVSEPKYYRLMNLEEKKRMGGDEGQKNLFNAG